MYLETVEINALKYMTLSLFIFFSTSGLAWKAVLKKTKNIEPLVDIDMLLIVERKMHWKWNISLYLKIHRN